MLCRASHTTKGQSLRFRKECVRLRSDILCGQRETSARVLRLTWRFSTQEMRWLSSKEGSVNCHRAFFICKLLILWLGRGEVDAVPWAILAVGLVVIIGLGVLGGHSASLQAPSRAA